MSDDTTQASLDEIAKDIEKLLNGGVEVTDEERQRRHFRYDVAKTCSHCADCERPLAPDEPIWRQRISLGRSMFGGTHHRLLPVCETCSHAKRSEYSYRYPHPSTEFRPAQPCEGCGRPVHERYRDGLFHRNHHVICCEDCYKAAELKYARETRTLARGTHECQICGKSFEPTRNDAKFCSSACKQKAYRKRVTDNS